MGQPLFFKSMCRQPVRTFLLLLLTAGLTFSFVIQAAEVLLIDREIAHISGQYRSVGRLYGLAGKAPLENCSDAVTEYLEQAPYVESANRRTKVSGVLQDGLYNADVVGYSFSSLPLPAAPLSANDIFFYGVYVSPEGVTDYYRFLVDEVVSGRPEYVSAGKTVTITTVSKLDLDQRDGKTSPPSIKPGQNTAAPEDTPAFKSGERYLVRATYDYLHCISPYTYFLQKPLYPGAPWSLSAPEDLNLSQYPQLSAELRQSHDNACAMELIAYTDVSGSPEAQSWSRDLYLTEGRWPDPEDDEAGVPTIALHKNMAATRGLKIGDTVTLVLRSAETAGWGYVGGPFDEVRTDYDTIPTSSPITYTICGLYGSFEEEHDFYTVITGDTSLSNRAYISMATIPDSFAPLHENDGNASCVVLDSPDHQEEFLAETLDALRSLGCQVLFPETGYEGFRTTAAAMRNAAQTGAAVFGVLFVGGLALIAFSYFHFRRRDLTISRILGVPARRCIWPITWPLLLIGGTGIAVGAVPAWIYTGAHASESLRKLSGSSYAPAENPLPPAALVLLLLSLFGLLLILSLALSLLRTGRPPLVLLRGAPGGKGARPANPAAEGPAVRPAAEAASLLLPPQTASASAGRPLGQIASFLRFIRRHILRTPRKSAACALLAVCFVVALMFLHISALRSAADLDQLYLSTPVEVELLQSSAAPDNSGEGFLPHALIEHILDSGYVSKTYLEGAAQSAYVQRGGSPSDRAYGVALRACEDPDSFFAREKVSGRITYFPGWDSSLFTRGSSSPVVILPHALWTQLNLTQGDSLSIFMLQDGTPRTAIVAGTYEGGDCILMSLAHMQRLPGHAMSYSRAVFTVVPEWNRDLPALRKALSDLTAKYSGAEPLSIVVWDRQLQQAVQPAEQMLSLIQTLYPITMILSVFTAAGIAVLLTLMSSKEAAIIRALGGSKLRCRLTLCLQIFFVCLVGVTAGHLASWVLAAVRLPEAVAALLPPSLGRAGLYLLAAILGAAGAATAMTTKNPLELLQTKE